LERVTGFTGQSQNACRRQGFSSEPFVNGAIGPGVVDLLGVWPYLVNGGNDGHR
jgi:hypothetical protein